MARNQWSVPDVSGMIETRRRNQGTTSANVGAYEVPLGRPGPTPVLRPTPGYELIVPPKK